MDALKVSRITFPTASFSLGAQHIDWIARRANALGMSKSAFVRRLIERDMDGAAVAQSNGKERVA